MNSSVPTALNSVSFLFEMTIFTETYRLQTYRQEHQTERSAAPGIFLYCRVEPACKLG